jgi:hypothetical protein
MTYKDDGVIGEIAAAEQAFREALIELAERLNRGQVGRATKELFQHCREMAEILKAAVDELGAGADEDATRAAAAQLLDRLLELEGAIGSSRLH